MPPITRGLLFPWVGVKRVADASGDRPGVNIAIIDLPTFVAGVSRSAAGEGGHGAISKRGYAVSATVGDQAPNPDTVKLRRR